MSRPVARRRPRGAALVELMIATVIMAVAMTGFVGAMNQAVTATSTGHRRTISAMLRTGLLDRWAVTPRVTTAAAAALDAWVIDACFDENAELVGGNGALDPAFACPESAFYRRWVRVTESSPRAWRLSAYIERIDYGCTPETRDASLGCVSADTLITD